MIYRTISLYDLQMQKVGKDVIQKILSDFSCPKNPDVEYFVHRKAYDFERVGMARTYLIYAYPKGENEPVLVAIYSLGQSDIEVSDGLTKQMRRDVFGTTYPVGKSIKTLLIGQISKNYTNGNDKFITGEIIMGLIFERIREIHMLFPSVVTHVDCKDVPELRKFYERFGFILFKKQDDMLVYLQPTNHILEVEFIS